MFYRFWRAIVVALSYVLTGVKVRGKDNVPRRGVYILAPSHRSTLDIAFAATVTTRRLRFMAKDELFKHPFCKWVFNELGAVPVDRDAPDRAAMRAIEGALTSGEPVVIFPEGTRYEGPTLRPLFSGAAYLSLKLGVPIVPIGVGGSEEPFAKYGPITFWSRACVVVGEPLYPPPLSGKTVKRSAITAMNDELTARLQECFDEAVEWSNERTGRTGRSGHASQ